MALLPSPRRVIEAHPQAARRTAIVGALLLCTACGRTAPWLSEREEPDRPAVLEVIPDRGATTGGGRVELIGRGYGPGLIIRFGEQTVTDLQVLSSTRAFAVVPAGQPQTVEVSAERASLFGGETAEYTYVGPPVLERVVPPYGATSGGATVEVQGQNFLEGMQVDFQGLPDADCTFQSSSSVLCTLPPGLPARYQVRVENPDGRAASLPDAIALFQLISVTPQEGPAMGGNEVQVVGVFLPPALEISFGEAPANCNQSTQDRWTCVAPAGEPNAVVDISALPPDPGQVPSVLPEAYLYLPNPIITDVIPDRVPLRGQEIVIIGRFFEPGITVTIRGVPCRNLVFISSEELRCVAPPGDPGQATIRATNPNGLFGDYEDFRYVPVTVAPEFGFLDGQTNLVLRGAGFSQGVQVLVGGQPALGVEVVSESMIRARTPPRNLTGPVTVRVLFPNNGAEDGQPQFTYMRYESAGAPNVGFTEANEILSDDFDGDGDQDLVFVSTTDRAQLMENQGDRFDGRLIGPPVPGFSGNTCDFDRDGDADMVWGSVSGPVLLRNNGGLAFSIVNLAPTEDSFEASFHDVNGNNRCDIIHMGTNGPDSVLINNGANFSGLAGALPHEPDFVHDHKIDSGDLDGDGDLDIVVMIDDVNFGENNPGHRPRVYLNQGEGRFVEDTRNTPALATVRGDVFDVRLGDIDGDGDIDVLAPNFNEPPVVLLNDGRGVLTRTNAVLPPDPRGDAAIVVLDLEGDGDLDVYLVNLDGAQPSALFLNDGEGGMTRALLAEPALPPPSRAARFADFDGDGVPDVVLGGIGGDNRMFLAIE